MSETTEPQPVLTTDDAAQRLLAVIEGKGNDFDAGPAASPSQPATLLQWAVARWRAEVANRPLSNIHRRTLDDTWRQLIRHLGGDPVALLGPAHDDLFHGSPEAQQMAADADKREREEARWWQGWKRYEVVRKLSIRQFAALVHHALDGEPFDKQVDRLVASTAAQTSDGAAV